MDEARRTLIRARLPTTTAQTLDAGALQQDLETTIADQRAVRRARAKYFAALASYEAARNELEEVLEACRRAHATAPAGCLETPRPERVV